MLSWGWPLHAAARAEGAKPLGSAHRPSVAARLAGALDRRPGPARRHRRRRRPQHARRIGGRAPVGPARATRTARRRRDRRAQRRGARRHGRRARLLDAHGVESSALAGRRRSASIGPTCNGRCTARRPTRAEAQTHIRLRPPFRIVWSLGIGSLIEFPAVVDDGVAYIGNARATIRAISMRDGHVLWRHDTPNGKMASSPAVFGDELVYHSMDGHVVRARPRDRRRFAGLWTRLADRVVADRAERHRLLRRVERHALRARPAHASPALDALARREDHLERGDRGRPPLHRRLRRAGSGRSRRAPARRAGSAP